MTGPAMVERKMSPPAPNIVWNEMERFSKRLFSTGTLQRDSYDDA
jgi:hypothetical protein